MVDIESQSRYALRIMHINCLCIYLHNLIAVQCLHPVRSVHMLTCTQPRLAPGTIAKCVHSSAALLELLLLLLLLLLKGDQHQCVIATTCHLQRGNMPHKNATVAS